MLGLVLTAGGARGAYQAGVLQRIGERPVPAGGPSPFAIVTGSSVGAINGSFVAAGSGDFARATRALADLWSHLTIDDVFRTDLPSLGATGMRWLRDLSLGGILGGGHVHSLLDASPLHDRLARMLPLDGIAESIREGWLYAVAVSATSYHSGRSFTFVQGAPGHPVWARGRRVAVATELTVDHICASASIPIVFPPVCVRTSEAGECFFGDGALRLVTPLSPAIRLGASKLFAIGVRCPASAEALHRAELTPDSAAPVDLPPLSQIFGVFLNALFLDHLDSDLDHLRRMNELVAASGPLVGAADDAAAAPIRTVEPLALHPSTDLALVAAAFADRMPRALRYVLDGLGTPNAQSADLLSYLLFDPAYTRALIDIGYRDASARIDEIEAFLADERPDAREPAAENRVSAAAAPS